MADALVVRREVDINDSDQLSASSRDATHRLWLLLPDRSACAWKAWPARVVRVRFDITVDLVDKKGKN